MLALAAGTKERKLNKRPAKANKNIIPMIYIYTERYVCLFVKNIIHSSHVNVKTVVALSFGAAIVLFTYGRPFGPKTLNGSH